jgi:Ca-activated chloride channel family protein
MSSPDKLPLLKESLKMMVAQLRPQERVSMVVYAGNAGLVLDSAPGYNKGLIMSAIDNLQAGGSTAGGQGIQLAYDVAQKNFIHNGNNRVILATDGDFNVGVSSDSELVQIIEEKRKAGIFLTVLGFGSGNLQDAKMEKLADKGNGNYFYIDTLAEGKKVLVDELGSTLIAIAKDVKIQIEFNPKAVKSYRLIGYENRKLAKEDFNDDTKDAGELGAGHTVTALYEIVPAGSWESTGGNVDPLKYQKQTTQKPLWGSDKEMMTVKLRYKEPKSETSQLITKVLNQPTNTFSQRWFGNSDNLQFASAVAEFGMLLRDSNFKAASSYQNVLQRAQNCSYHDPAGYKNEFIALVQKAAALDTRPTPVPVYQPQYQNYPVGIDEQGGYNQKGQ